MAGALESALRLALPTKSKLHGVSRHGSNAPTAKESGVLWREPHAAIADGSLVSTPRRKAAQEATTHVPVALQMYAVETRT